MLPPTVSGLACCAERVPVCFLLRYSCQTLLGVEPAQVVLEAIGVATGPCV